ncbi:MAG TPA: winged helix-turn-helix domain-containing protein [Terracidiphilus sp.]|nr:winged helix-turn-helix domain-containing protein [Terracidiphilus sp.]
MNRPFADPTGRGEPANSARQTSEWTFSFAGFSLEPDGSLFRGGTLVHLPPKELAALRVLLMRAGHVVTAQEMRKALWGDVHVSPDSVTKCVSSLRARLQLEDCIQTVYKRGYRFSANVAQHLVGANAPRARLAIAPFATGPGVADYLGSAVAEETATGLTQARHPVVSVLSQDSVSTLARRGFSAHEIGTTLKADFVLTGTLRVLPSHYRLGAEMIRVRDGVQVWAEDVLVSRKRTAGLELEIATRLNFRLNTALPTSLPAAPALHIEGLSIAALAEPSISGDSIATLERGDEATRQLAAYEMFLSARQEWRSLQRHQMLEGVEHLLRAIELDPSLTGARVDLANLCVAQAIYGFMPPDVAAATARKAAEPIADPVGRATSILPALGWFSFHYDHDLPSALHAFAQSAHLPHDAWTTRARSFFALSRHRFTEAFGILRDAMTLDPYSPWLHGRLAWALHLAGEAQQSLAQAKHALEQFPQEPVVNFYGSLVLAFNGEAKRATEIARNLETRVPHLDIALSARAYALARANQTDEARQVLEQIEWRSRERFAITCFNAAVYLELGEPDEAIKVLKTSIENRCPWFFQFLADPRLKPLHGRPEFEEMRRLLAQMEAQAIKPE